MRSVTSRAGKTRPLALVVAFGVLATALYAYKHVFQRPGEEAISLVPADAVVVASIDLSPGPDQVAFFARLAKAMHDDHLDDPFQTVLKSSPHDHGLFSALRPQLGVSYAAAGWKRNPADSQVADGVVIAAIKDPAATETILARFGTQERSGTLSAFHLKDNNGYACVLKSYLVAADSIQNLNRVAMVAHGDGASVSGLQSFRDARSRLPGSANLMLFVDLCIANTATTKTKQKPGIAWATCSATLRENGIELLMKSPTAFDDAIANTVRNIRPINTANLYSFFPSHPYGLMAIAQPANYWSTKSMLSALGSDASDVDKSIRDFEKEMHLNVERDILTGLQGNFAIAVYPSSNPDKQPIPDGLIVIDDQNGSDPATMIEKIKQMVVEQSSKDGGHAPSFRSETVQGATIWTLDEDTQRSLRETSGLGQPPVSPTSTGGIEINNSNGGTVQIGGSGVTVQSGNTVVKVADGGVHVDAGGGTVKINGSSVVTSMPGGVKIDVNGSGIHIGSSAPVAQPASVSKPEEKQLIWAVCGKTVLIASSRILIERAIADHTQNKDRLDSDSAMAANLKEVSREPREILVLDAHAVLQTIAGYLGKVNRGNDEIKPGEIAELVGSTGLICSQGFEDGLITARAVIPCNWEKALKLAATVSARDKRNSTTITR